MLELRMELEKSVRYQQKAGSNVGGRSGLDLNKYHTLLMF